MSDDDLRRQIETALGAGYALERELGGGGMSRVFVATEAALGRRLVVKVLPPETVAHASIERFKREIQVAASLQHPHIVPLLSAGEAAGLPYYTMPFVKGESLRERLTKGGELSVKETLHILHDVAAALAYAHAEGVVHRDIKPENIMLSGGVAVVTDFGVAKAVNVAATVGGGAVSSLTSLGVALGTPAYMAPEQATADVHVDHRADIYSFGCLAYELLSGTSPFGGRPPQQLLTAHVMEAPVSVTTRRPNVPAALAALVMQCLEKRPGDRPQSAEELLAALDAISTPSGGTMPTSARVAAVRRPRTTWYVSAAVLIALGAAAAIWRWPRQTPSTRVGATSPVAVSPAIEMEPAISPDGKFVAYAAGAPGARRIVIQQVSGGRPVALTSNADGDAGGPRWAPDGSRVLYEARGGVYVVPALGGTPQRLIETASGTAETPAWSPDGQQIVYSDGQGLVVRPTQGGSARRIVEGISAHAPAWSPDGRLLVYVDGNRASLLNLSATSLRVISRDGGLAIRISDSTHVNISPVWTPDGKSVLFISNREGLLDVYQQAVRADGRPVGSPTRLTTGLQARTISLSADGSRLSYDVVRNRSNLWMVPIAPAGVAPMTAATQLTTEGQRIEAMGLSTDGQWIAYDSDRGGNFDIYKLRIAGGEPIQLTTNPGNDFRPSWSPDNREIVFHSSRSGKRELYVIGAEGAGNGERQITNTPVDVYSPDWSPDGQRILFASNDGAKRFTQIITKSTNGRWSSPRPLVTDSAGIVWAAWSPDGQHIACVVPTPSGFAAGGLGGFAGTLLLLSPDGGEPRMIYDRQSSGEWVMWAEWGKDPNVVFFNTVDSNSRVSFWSMPIADGQPRLLLRDDPEHRVGRFDFVTDGRRLFFTLAADESDVFVMELKRSQ